MQNNSSTPKKRVYREHWGFILIKLIGVLVIIISLGTWIKQDFIPVYKGLQKVKIEEPKVSLWSVFVQKNQKPKEAAIAEKVLGGNAEK